jgi:hypothetical protein
MQSDRPIPPIAASLSRRPPLTLMLSCVNGCVITPLSTLATGLVVVGGAASRRAPGCEQKEGAPPVEGRAAAAAGA